MPIDLLEPEEEGVGATVVLLAEAVGRDAGRLVRRVEAWRDGILAGEGRVGAGGGPGRRLHAPAQPGPRPAPSCGENPGPR